MLALVRLLVEVHDLASSVQVKSNRPFSDEPEVSGRMPLFGQSLPLRHSVCTDNYLCQFQSGVRGPVPLDSSFAHPSTFGECLDRVLGVGPELVQAQHSFGRIGGGGVGFLRLRRLLQSCVDPVYLCGLSWACLGSSVS